VSAAAPVEPPLRAVTGTLCALGAIALWATLASLGVALAHVPPFLLTGLALVVGSVPSWPLARRWRVPPSTLLLGVYGLFGFHFLLFVALRTAPPLEANLVNYLWPLLIVVLAPVLLPNVALRPLHVVAAGAGFAGAALAILGGREASGGFSWGYLAAAGSAVVWASYSLLTQRVAHFPTAAIGLFGLVSGLLALACHALLEAPVALSTRDALLIAAIGIGPLGAAFFLWDAALKRSDARRIGLLSYLTPLASTLLLALTTSRPLTPWIGAAALLIVGAAIVGLRTR
jgi:drug/metabolite transporter (DMT)-like permease